MSRPKKQEIATSTVVGKIPALDNTVPPVPGVREYKSKFGALSKLTPDQGLEILDFLLQQSFPPEKINEILKQLCEADDIKMSKTGIEYTTPNWFARSNGLDHVLKLKRFISPSGTNVGDQPITKITFNVVNNVEVKTAMTEKEG